MNMAEKKTLVCDSCGSDVQVGKLTVVYDEGKTAPWEVDLCRKDYEALFKQLLKQSRRATRTRVKPLHRMQLTEVDADNL